MRKISPLPVLDLAKVISRLQAEQCENVETCITQYLQYLALCKTYPEYPIMPTEEADKAWHVHILHTREYAADCQRYFGFFLHHNPTMPAREVGERSMSLFQRHFGVGGATLVMCGCQDEAKVA